MALTSKSMINSFRLKLNKVTEHFWSYLSSTKLALALFYHNLYFNCSYSSLSITQPKLKLSLAQLSPSLFVLYFVFFPELCFDRVVICRGIGMVKKGIKIGHNEFNKGNLFWLYCQTIEFDLFWGCKVLSDRCLYRLLTPLSTAAYAEYLDQATQHFLW